jgi:hypothetical protein
MVEVGLSLNQGQAGWLVSVLSPVKQTATHRIRTVCGRVRLSRLNVDCFERYRRLGRGTTMQMCFFGDKEDTACDKG